MAKQQHLSPSHPMPRQTTDRTREKATNAAHSNHGKKHNGGANDLRPSSALAIGGGPGEYHYDPEKGDDDPTELPPSPTTAPPQPRAVVIVLEPDLEHPPFAVAVPLGSSLPRSEEPQSPQRNTKPSSPEPPLEVPRWILGTLCGLTILLLLASIGIVLARGIEAHHHVLRGDDDDGW